MKQFLNEIYTKLVSQDLKREKNFKLKKMISGWYDEFFADPEYLYEDNKAKAARRSHAGGKRRVVSGDRVHVRSGRRWGGARVMSGGYGQREMAILRVS